MVTHSLFFLLEAFLKNLQINGFLYVKSAKNKTGRKEPITPFSLRYYFVFKTLENSLFKFACFFLITQKR